MRQQRTIDQWLRAQGGLVAVWQLLEAGYSKGAVRHAARGWSEVHDGVFLSGHAAPTWWQIWKAATLTAPDSRLSLWSAGAFLGIRPQDRFPTTITRPGSGGPELVPARDGRIGSVRIYRSNALLDDDTRVLNGISTFGAPRTLLDLTARTREETAGRFVRDAFRLKVTSPADLQLAARRHTGRRGVATLRRLTERYGPFAGEIIRSDPEILAAVLLVEAGFERPLVNHLIEGEEADLAWVRHKRILELDGPQFHLFPERDAAKQAVWEDAGWAVDRVPTSVVYDNPALLLSLAPPPGPSRLAA